MGILIIYIVLIFEVAFATYSIKSENYHNDSRSLVRIVAFIAFIGVVLTPIIDWSFRWYLLGTLLAILAVIGGVRISTKRYGEKPYRRWRIVTKGIVMLLIFSIVTIPAIAFPQYEEPKITGEYKVKTSSYTFTDTTRIETFKDTGENRKLTVQFWYPEEKEGVYPLIVFSHGAFGVRMSNSSTFTDLASHGYVVCSIDHPYHAAGTVDINGKLTIGSNEFIQEVVDANSDIYSEKEQFNLFSKWMDLRTDDINFVLDTILDNTENSDIELYGLIDRNKIGLIGHSLGGAASAQIGRERKDISAVINLDGSMLGEYRSIGGEDPVINDEPYLLPLLNFYSEYVINELLANPEYIYPNKYITSISQNAFETYIKGSNHMSYTDLPLFSPILARQLSGISGGLSKANVDEYYCIETMNRLVLEFFNCYIKGEGAFTVKEFY
jgi:dienelactone hydrolase